MGIGLGYGEFAFQSSPSPKTGRYSASWETVRLGLGLFQSSPSPKTGRYLRISLRSLVWSSSNPHPVRKLGAITCVKSPILFPTVSSNPHPVRKLGAILVVISPIFCSSSNPHPVRKLGAIICVLAIRRSRMFQSSPSPKTGRYGSIELSTGTILVPILTQSENWALSRLYQTLTPSVL